MIGKVKGWIVLKYWRKIAVCTLDETSKEANPSLYFDDTVYYEQVSNYGRIGKCIQFSISKMVWFCKITLESFDMDISIGNYTHSKNFCQIKQWKSFCCSVRSLSHSTPATLAQNFWKEELNLNSVNCHKRHQLVLNHFKIRYFTYSKIFKALSFMESGLKSKESPVTTKQIKPRHTFVNRFYQRRKTFLKSTWIE